MQEFLGEYLVEHNYVTAEQVLAALEIQAKSRVPLGQLAIQSGYLKGGDVLKVLKAQKLSANGPAKFGEIVTGMGLLTEEQLQALQKMQDEKMQLLGKILVDQGFLKPPALVKALREFEGRS